MDGDGKNEKSRKPAKGWHEPLWERQPGETDKAFRGFGAFRDLGPDRTLAAAGQTLGTSKAACEQWSVKWGWVERASAWDDEADRNQRKRDEVERQQAITRMRENHAKAGIALQNVAGLALQERFGDKAPADAKKKDLAKLTAADIRGMMDTGVKLELRARGEATERIEMGDAMRWVEGFVDVALGYVPLEAQEAFISDVKARLGSGSVA